MYDTPHVRDIPVNWEWIAAETAPSMVLNLGGFASFDDQEQEAIKQMPWEVNVEQLFAFVRERAEEINRTPVPHDIRAAIADTAAEHVKDVQALWIAAGVATQLGLAIVDDPERFIHELPHKNQLHLELVSAPKPTTP